MQYESKKSNQQQDLDDEDWFKRVLEENKAQKLLAQQQGNIFFNVYQSRKIF